MIELYDFSIGYGSCMLLDKVDTSFGKGQLTALIGRNGTGKSTLLRAIAGLNRHYSGEVLLNDRKISGMQPQELARTLAFVTTERTRIPNLRCEDVVAIGRAPYTNWIGRMQDIDRRIVTDAIRSVGMESYALRTMDTMSDGECQRIMIARALAQDTPVSLLQSLAHNQGKCVLFSTHELDVALQMCDSIALVDDGALYHLSVPEMVSSGHIQRLFRTPNLSIERLCASFITDRQ